MGFSSTLATSVVHSCSESQFSLKSAPPSKPSASPRLLSVHSLTSLVVLSDCFFNSVVVGVPCSLISWHLWLFIDFRLVAILLLVVWRRKEFLPTLPSWPELPALVLFYFYRWQEPLIFPMSASYFLSLLGVWESTFAHLEKLVIAMCLLAYYWVTHLGNTRHTINDYLLSMYVKMNIFTTRKVPFTSLKLYTLKCSRATSKCDYWVIFIFFLY